MQHAEAVSTSQLKVMLGTSVESRHLVTTSTYKTPDMNALRPVPKSRPYLHRTYLKDWNKEIIKAGTKKKRQKTKTNKQTLNPVP